MDTAKQLLTNNKMLYSKKLLTTFRTGNKRKLTYVQTCTKPKYELLKLIVNISSFCLMKKTH